MSEHFNIKEFVIQFFITSQYWHNIKSSNFKSSSHYKEKYQISISYILVLFVDEHPQNVKEGLIINFLGINQVRRIFFTSSVPFDNRVILTFSFFQRGTLSISQLKSGVISEASNYDIPSKRLQTFWISWRYLMKIILSLSWGVKKLTLRGIKKEVVYCICPHTRASIKFSKTVIESEKL